MCRTFQSLLRLEYPHPTPTEKQCLESAHATLEVARSFSILTFFYSRTSDDLPKEDVIRILDASFILQHVKSSQGKSPTDILTNVRPHILGQIRIWEQALLEFQQQLVFQGQVAGVAPEDIPELSRASKGAVVGCARFYMSSKKRLLEQLPLQEARKVAGVLQTLLKTVFEQKKDNDLYIQLTGAPITQPKRSIEDLERKRRDMPARVVRECEQMLRVTRGCSQTEEVQRVQKVITHRLEQYKKTSKNG
jgi:hypothetical protein